MSLQCRRNVFVVPQTCGPVKVRCPTPSDRLAKFPASTLHERSSGEGEGGADEPHIHNQREFNVLPLSTRAYASERLR